MDPIIYLDRTTQQKEHEQIYGKKALSLLYGHGWLTCLIGAPLVYLLSRIPFFSKFVGYLKKRPASVKDIGPFIREFHIDSSEFLEVPQSFDSFNAFFIRKLKPSARPIATGSHVAVIPADGRYWFYQKYDEAKSIIVKGQRLNLSSLLGNEHLAAQYAQGAMAIARLCPTDYHRYHFPCDCIPGKTELINGWLYSVSPLAIRKNLEIFSQNKRTLCILHTQNFGKVLYLEIGATCVGAIHQTYTPFKTNLKGEEKGYFSFGASSLILLFPPNSIRFDQDLLDATAQNLEIKCLMGQSMGVSLFGMTH